MVVFMYLWIYTCIYVYMHIYVYICVHTFVYVTMKKVNKFERERIC